MIFTSDILSYVLIERECFRFYFPHPVFSIQPNFPAIDPLLSLTGRHTAPQRPAGVLLFLDPLNCIHIESELIRIVQVRRNQPEIIKGTFTPRPQFLSPSMLPK